MKHIKVIIYELQTSGKYEPNQKMTKTKKVIYLRIRVIVILCSY